MKRKKLPELIGLKFKAKADTKTRARKLPSGIVINPHTTKDK